ncbi:hypothetical protein ElyMa_004313100 [Elysia marginata]|uniref:Uncharacterized protein n=1 Tax=Elysia marginata TaxID=1093978 RepID=A0AAV4GZG9_9GAST|nr:hypothetical protein ElyMa_004313100 [Elysia marginata]
MSLNEHTRNILHICIGAAFYVQMPRKHTKRIKLTGPGLSTVKELRAQGYGYTRLFPHNNSCFYGYMVNFITGVPYSQAIFTMQETDKMDVSCTVYVFVGHRRMVATIRDMRAAQVDEMTIRVIERKRGWVNTDESSEDEFSGDDDDDSDENKEYYSPYNEVGMEVISGPYVPPLTAGFRSLALIKILSKKGRANYKRQHRQSH